jgi:signal transduction histidine kinase
MKRFFDRLSLAQRFLLVSFPILLAGTLVLGSWIGEQVEDSVAHKIGSVTGLYVDSFIAPHVQTLAHADDLTDADRAELASLLRGTALGSKIVSLKIWGRDGRILFSSNPSEIGQKKAIDEGLAVALGGGIYSELSSRSAAEQAAHGAPLSRVIETYTPIHADRLGTVVGVAEFYQASDEVDREAAVVRRQSWLVIAQTMIAMYVLLFVIVYGGSRTIERHERELERRVEELTRLNQEKSTLTRKVRRAAERATALNENFLQRISSDIHDGPGQDIGFALMQLQSACDACSGSVDPKQCALVEYVPGARRAVESALKDLKSISAGLQLPDIGGLSIGEIACRAVRDFQTKTGGTVSLAVERADAPTSLRVKITVYRLLQEALANSFRHARGRSIDVRVEGDPRAVTLEVHDDGPGFDTAQAMAKGRLGLSGMRQRAEILGGSFDITSTPGDGTRVRVQLPLAGEEVFEE